MIPLTIQFELRPEDIYHWSNWVNFGANGSDTAAYPPAVDAISPTGRPGEVINQNAAKARRGMLKYAGGFLFIALVSGVAYFAWPQYTSFFVPVLFGGLGALMLWLRRLLGRAPKHWSVLSPESQKCFAESLMVVDQIHARTLMLESAGVTEASEGMMLRLDWSAIRAVKRLPGVTVLQFAAAQAVLIPTRALPPGVTADALAGELATLAAAARTGAPHRVASPR